MAAVGFTTTFGITFTVIGADVAVAPWLLVTTAVTGYTPTGTLAQVTVLYRRARIIRMSITLAATSAALAAVMIVALFVNSLLQSRLDFLIGLLFVACMCSLFASLVAFIRDINLSLHALKLELEFITGQAKEK